MDTRRLYGIPDIDLPLPGGGTVNPSDFAGHELVVLFCPTDRGAAVRELTDYQRNADKFSYDDAWMIAVGGGINVLPASRMTLTGEPDRRAWDAFCETMDPPRRLPREEGAVFLFGRGGCLTRLAGAWPCRRCRHGARQAHVTQAGLSRDLRTRRVWASRESSVMSRASAFHPPLFETNEHHR